MNDILKKRIEEAAGKRSFKYLSQDRIEELELGCHYEEGFMEGAQYALSHQWISVDEALPTRYTFVVTADKYGHLNFAQVDEKGLWFGNSYPVDYWMPIPELKLNCNG